MATKYKILGMADEGTCEHCGANCPKRRVGIVAVDADGNATAEPFSVGCICAAELTGNRSRSNANRIRQQAENADRMAQLHREDEERRFQFRVNGKWHPDVDPASRDTKAAANMRYRATGRPLVGSYLAQNDAGQIVRVDGNSAADVAMFAGRGFRQITGAVTADGLAPMPLSAVSA